MLTSNLRYSISTSYWLRQFRSRYLLYTDNSVVCEMCSIWESIIDFSGDTSGRVREKFAGDVNFRTHLSAVPNSR